MTRRSLAALVAFAAAGLTACGASAPPAEELAIEVIDSMLERGEITEATAECMTERVGEYEDDELDRIVENADAQDDAALEQLDQFQADLEACRVGPQPAGG